MPLITETGTLFKPELVTEIFNKVKGKSSLAKLCKGEPIPFAGTETFVFTMDGEASIVGEGGAKPAGQADLKPVTIKPIKFIYQHRVTDEFLNITNEKRLPFMREFTDACSMKMARALDIAGFHGVNPYDGNLSETVGDKSFDARVTKTVNFIRATPDDNVDTAVGLIRDSDGEVNGIAMSSGFGAALGQMKTADSHVAMYPEYRFGGNPATFAGGIASDVNTTVGFNSSADEAIIGDFANAFKWGYAENVKFEIITTGDPDGLGDLKRHNQIVLRVECYIGWGILDPDSFARIVNTDVFAGPTVGAEADTATAFGTKVSAMQSKLSVGNGAVTGTLKYLTSGQLVDKWGEGNFMAIKLNADQWDKYSSVQAGLEPSVESGLVEIKDDPDKGGVFKVTDKGTQRLKVVAVSADGKKVHTQYFSLNGLNCNTQ